jgi:hypothetical protein
VVSLITFVTFVKLPASDPARRATGKATTGRSSTCRGSGSTQ